VALFQGFASGTQTDSASYTYDALNRIASETETHPQPQRIQDPTQLSYFGQTSLPCEEQLSTSGTTTDTRDYTYDPYGHRLTLTDTPSPSGIPGSPTTFGYGYDVLGSVSQLVDPYGGVRADYGYTAYGRPDTGQTQGDTSTTSPFNPFRSEAKRLDSGTGNVNMGARQYGPALSHFITPAAR
jgi:hypothetical protein